MVTGGAGFIGSHVVDLYLENGHEVVVVDNLSTGKIQNVNPGAIFYQLDIRSEKMKDVFVKEKPEIVNHHAAQIDVRYSTEHPGIDADINILGSIKLLQLSQQYGVRKFIYISSGGAIYGEPEHLPCDESHPVKPLSPYGAGKYAFELYLYMYKVNYGLDYTILRYANVYGPRQDPHGEAGVVAIFTGRMIENKPVTINGSGEQIRDFVFVKDCAKANLIALDQGSGSAYNFGSGIGTTINQIFQTLKDINQYNQEPVFGPEKKGETFRIYLDIQKALQELNWAPEINIEEGLRKTADFFISPEN
jgi:UDP-glucose 4-epimerase